MANTSIQQFLEEIQPYFSSGCLGFVDAGAHKGNEFQVVAESPLSPSEAHLFEPNSTTFAALGENAKRVFKKRSLNLYNVALGDTPGRVVMKDADTMSKVIGSVDERGESAASSNATAFEVDCVTLDSLADNFTDRRISLLKVDVEGYEMQVLRGAKGLLSEQRIDVIYIEAGLNPEGTQQTYYRLIDDYLMEHGYRLFRIYEQKHEWMEDSPFLRRMNMAYFSKDFAARHPYKLTHQLYEQAQAARKPAAQAAEPASAKASGEKAAGEKAAKAGRAEAPSAAGGESISFRQAESFHWLTKALRLQRRLPHLYGREMAPDVLLDLHEWVREHRPHRVVSLGSGASSLVIADALRQNGMGRLVAIDHLNAYAERARAALAREYLKAWAEVREAPMTPWAGEHPAAQSSVDNGEKGDKENQAEKAKKDKKDEKGEPPATPSWYSEDALKGLGPIDLLVVDGPAQSSVRFVRYPALPALLEQLSDSAEVWLDDAKRADEKAIVDAWAQRYGFTVDWVKHEKGLARLKRQANQT